MPDALDSAKEEIKKIARIGLFLKDYGIIVTLGVKFAAVILWSANTYHYRTAQLDGLVESVKVLTASNKELVSANTAQAKQINAINKRYARLTKMIQIEAE